MHQRHIYLKRIASSILNILICAFAIYKFIPYFKFQIALSTLEHPAFQKAINLSHLMTGASYLTLALGSLSVLLLFINIMKFGFSYTAKGKELMAQAEANEAIRIAEEKIQSAQRYKEYQKREERLQRDERNSSSNDFFMSPASPVWSHSSSSSSSGGWSGGDSGSWSGGSCDSGSSGGGGDCSGGGD
ncbi:hypothetical protein ALQ37_200168 [Pseudomonas syringae pv. aptata]|uniref:Uncharacterized protein n=1 Tax=Pseudomonas syringae pv. aptata TaxID=83167 RepID=A0A3M3X656_PSEAP|nr:hypothetical protein [Pseudomonas syringae]RMO65472.1 hypothetical protein ALQ37_200168 [Pseudomonas syringae pv. aptata]